MVFNMISLIIDMRLYFQMLNSNKNNLNYNSSEWNPMTIGFFNCLIKIE